MAARGRDVLLRLKGDSGDAKRALAEVRSDLRRMSREEATAKLDIQTARAERALDKINARIARFRADGPVTKDVDLKIRKAEENATLISLRLDRLRLKRVEIDVDVKRGAVERTTAALGSVDRVFQKLSRSAGGFGGGFFGRAIGNVLQAVFGGISLLAGGLEALPGIISTVGGFFSDLASGAVSAFKTVQSTIQGLIAGTTSIGQVLGSVVSGIVSALASLPTIALSIVAMGAALAAVAALGGAVVIALNAILGAIIALGGALVALVASAAAAAAGLGALAVAFGAVLIPVAIVAFGVFQRFQAILKAHQAQQQAVTQATQAAKTAEQAHTQALQERKRAEEQLAAATVAGRNAMAQATQNETDAELGLRNARNGVQDARLQLALAKRDLREFLSATGAAQGSVNALFQKGPGADPAQLRSLIGGVAGSAKTKVDPLDLQQKIQAIRDAQLGVANATNQVTHAQDTLNTAQQKQEDFARRGLRAYAPYRQALEAVVKANQRVARTQDQTTAAQRKYQQALKGLSSTEQGTLGRLNQLLDGFKKLSKAFTDPVFKALNDVFDTLKGKAGEFEDALSKVGTAFADVVRAVGTFLTDPRTLSAFQTMATGAASLVRELGAHAFVSFLTIMREVATTALPAVIGAARSLSGWLARIAGEPGKIHSAVRAVVAQFQTWARFAGAVANLVIALFSAAAPAGKSLAQSMTKIVERWTAWIKENPKKVRDFFHDAANETRKIVTWISEAVSWLKDHLPKAAAAAKNAFQTIIPVATKILKIITTWVDLIRGDLPKAIKDAGIGANLNKAGKPGGGVGPGTPLPLIIPDALKKFFFGASGGLIPGSGRGDHVPAMLEPGEFVLRRSVVQALSLPVLHALNGGAVPAMATGGVPVIHNHHWTIPQPLDAMKSIDSGNLAALIQQEWTRRGGGLS